MARLWMSTFGHALILGLLLIVVPYSYGCLPSNGVAYSVGVGDPVCWSIPPTRDYYTSWSNSRFFKIGDTLVFNFQGGSTNVLQVTKQDYESCTSYNKPFKMFNNGPANFTLVEKGVFYFITNISNYCSLGQKVSISVHECDCPVDQPPPVVVTPPHSPSTPAPSNSVPPAATRSTSRPPAAAPSPNRYFPVAKSAASVLVLHKGMLHHVLHGIFFAAGWVAILELRI